MEKQITQIALALRTSMARENYAGFDPFDGLNSKLFRATGLNQFYLTRLAWQQFCKRSPVNVRPISLVGKTRNPKGVALTVLGMIEEVRRTKSNDLVDEIINLCDWLADQRCDRIKWTYSCWGYNFDWQSRAFFVQKGTPNLITTCYVARALFNSGELLGKDGYRNIAIEAGHFIHRHLQVSRYGSQFYAYIPDDETFVHNANLWGAAWVGLAGSELNDSTLVDSAIINARTSVAEQSDSGAWSYGQMPHHQFVDGFHTGFNLEALNLLRKSVATDEFDDNINVGMKYYRENFFLEDGTAKYYQDRVYPLDMHSFSQGIITLLNIADMRSDLALAKKIAGRAIESLYSTEDMKFIYQRGRWLKNRIDYIRWTQSWAYLSFMLLARCIDEEEV